MQDKVELNIGDSNSESFQKNKMCLQTNSFVELVFTKIEAICNNYGFFVTIP